ncbi:MAG: AraC family transcriptional regulator [Bacteroidales bacterium]|nr:AraC family transcriptional regulator [Bacteroidales bacterium]
MKSKNEPDIELSKVELDRMVNSDAPNDRQNFITDDVSLITDNSLYRKNMPLQRIYQTANPEIILVMQGNADYNVNNLPYKLGKGDLFIVPIGTIFQVRFRSDDFKLKVIDYHLNQDNKMNYYALWLKRHHLTESDFFRVNHYYELIHECYSSHMEMRESVVYIVLALLHDINRTLAKDGNQTVTLKREEQVYVDFMKLLMEDYDMLPRAITYYSDKLNLNANLFGTIVKKVSGLSPLNWINRVTMDTARSMLINGSASMSGIARKVCFTEQASFTRFFKKEEGMSPLDYRKKFMGGKPQAE